DALEPLVFYAIMAARVGRVTLNHSLLVKLSYGTGSAEGAPTRMRRYVPLAVVRGLRHRARTMTKKAIASTPQLLVPGTAKFQVLSHHVPDARTTHVEVEAPTGVLVKELTISNADGVVEQIWDSNEVLTLDPTVLENVATATQLP